MPVNTASQSELDIALKLVKLGSQYPAIKAFADRKPFFNWSQLSDVELKSLNKILNDNPKLAALMQASALHPSVSEVLRYSVGSDFEALVGFSSNYPNIQAVVNSQEAFRDSPIYMTLVNKTKAELTVLNQLLSNKKIDNMVFRYYQNQGAKAQCESDNAISLQTLIDLTETQRKVLTNERILCLITDIEFSESTPKLTVQQALSLTEDQMIKLTSDKFFYFYNKRELTLDQVLAMDSKMSQAEIAVNILARAVAIKMLKDSCYTLSDSHLNKLSVFSVEFIQKHFIDVSTRICAESLSDILALSEAERVLLANIDSQVLHYVFRDRIMSISSLVKLNKDQMAFLVSNIRSSGVVKDQIVAGHFHALYQASKGDSAVDDSQLNTNGFVASEKQAFQDGKASDEFNRLVKASADEILDNQKRYKKFVKFNGKSFDGLKKNIMSVLSNYNEPKGGKFALHFNRHHHELMKKVMLAVSAAADKVQLKDAIRDVVLKECGDIALSKMFKGSFGRRVQFVFRLMDLPVPVSPVPYAGKRLSASDF